MATTCSICGVTFTDNDLSACSSSEARDPTRCFYGRHRAGQPPEDAFQAPSHTDMMVAPETDAVTRPHHYARFAIEPIEFIMVNDLPFWVGNVVKYALRYDAKNGIEDLRKARRYLDMQIKKMEGDSQWAK